MRINGSVQTIEEDSSRQLRERTFPNLALDMNLNDLYHAISVIEK